MSLDVYLEDDEPVAQTRNSGIFVRENGATVEITREEWDRRNPGVEPVVFTAEPDEEDRTLYTRNITHNLGRMAEAAGIYKHLWRPEEIGIKKARQLIEPLSAGLRALQTDPARFRMMNPENGWGTYEGLVAFVDDYLRACERFPTAAVVAHR